ncbi:MAG: phage major capsid protein, partial [Gemmataceae bacterium]
MLKRLNRTTSMMATKSLGRLFIEAAKKEKSLTVNSGADGGYLLSDEHLVNVDDFLREFGLFHRYAKNFAMKGSELQVAGVDTSKTTTDESPLFGGLTLSWRTAEEMGNLTADPSFDIVKFRASGMLGGVLPVPNQLLDDSAQAGEYIEGLLEAAVEHAVEKACLVGTGIGAQPLGVVNEGSTVVVNRSGASAIAIGDVTGMIVALFPASFDRAIWVASPTAIPKLAAISGFQVASASMTPEAPTRLVGSLMTRPLFVTGKLPTLGTKGDIVLFDPSLYGLARRELSIQRSRNSSFNKNVT